MNPDKRRRGRAIRKQRRRFRELGEAFTALGLAAGIAAENLGQFLQTAVQLSKTEDSN